MPNRVAAVVVTYNIGEKYLENFVATSPQVEKIFIVDNGSNPETQEMLKKLEKADYDKTLLIINFENVGLAKAQNQGIQAALAEKFDWVLLLDHDSKPEPDMVNTMLATYETYRNKELVAILAPNLVQPTGQVAQYVCRYYDVMFTRETFEDKPYLDEVAAVIASGSLIKSRIFDLYGMMKESFFIDYVDVDFCLRITSKGYRILAVRDAKLYHELGAKTVHKLGPFKIIASNHSAERRYTIYKNRAIVWREFIFKSPSYVLYDFLAAIYDIFRILIAEQDKKLKLKNIWQGMREAFKKNG